MGVITSSVFALRNMDKISRGDIGRAPVPVVQLFNTTNELAKMNLGQISEKATQLLERVDDVGRLAGVSNVTTKAASVTSKLVNPLLCAASGVRILKDDDKQSALIEEGLAMGAMFGAEKIAKIARSKVEDAIKTGSLDGITKNATVKKVGSKVLEKISKMGKGSWQKTALFVAAELLFVAISVAAFDIGKKAGKKITGRDGQDKVNKGSPPNNPFESK